MDIISVNGGRLQFSSQNIMLYNRDRDALLRVARVAKAKEVASESYHRGANNEREIFDAQYELHKALKEVEHLL